MTHRRGDATSKVLSIEGLSKSYGRVVGVRDLTFAVPRGGVFGFLGPNGAGKTTTIRLLMQMLRPDSGRIVLLDTPLDRRRPQLHERIGYLPGDFRPVAEMRAGRFLAYMARFRHRPPALRDELSERLGFGEKERRQRIKHLSQGNRQKLGLIFALEHDPELAILDEPSLGLDPLVQEAFYELVRSLRDRGTTLFLSSHHLAEVEKVCSRVAIIRSGRLVAEASVEDLKRERPRRLIVVLDRAGIESPMLPEASLLERDGDRCAYRVDGDVRATVTALMEAGIREFYLPEPSLEDVFMAHYRGAEQ